MRIRFKDIAARVPFLDELRLNVLGGIISRGIGLFDWKYYVNKQGSFVLQQESVINQKHGGQTTPALPCTSSYE